ncbi:MAG: hypothetical protein C3F07_00945 [Anaerolineales bacterium]|nr:hypothetical protein [Anaerolineae bacterium]PWB77910.1 MAG: hypothetical protein C3F07_00945 [Anaerolineales bacterium]
MPPLNDSIKRIAISLLIGLVFGVTLNEISFLFLKETARPPQDILLTIPEGTAEQVARGEQPPTIPENMVFVVGDVLTVRNEDVVDHKLGPLWIPANSSAQLPLGQVENLAFECSFQPGNYFGLDVREPLTTSMRFFGILYSGLPLGVLIALYSLAFPSKKTENAPA